MWLVFLELRSFWGAAERTRTRTQHRGGQMPGKQRVAGVDVRGRLILWRVVWEGLLGEGAEPGEFLGPVWRWLSAWEAHSAG